MTSAGPAYLITGATGFLGRHILEALKRDVPQARPVVLVRAAQSWESQPWREALGDIEVVSGSLLDTESWKTDPRLAAGLKGIFHLAAEVKHTRHDTDTMLRTNVEGTLAMVRLAAEMKCRLLFVSTSGAVSCSPLPGEGAYEDAPYCEDVVGDWPYYASKIRAEKEAGKLACVLGVDLIIFRPPVLLGPGDHRLRSTSNVMRVLRGKLPFILEGGMSFVDIRDAATAMVRAMVHENPKPVYHLSGTACTLDEFFRMVANQADIKPAWRILPGVLLRWASEVNAASGLRLHILPDPVVVEMASHYWDVSSRHAETDLGYRSRPPERTIADTISWIRENQRKP